MTIPPNLQDLINQIAVVRPLLAAALQTALQTWIDQLEAAWLAQRAELEAAIRQHLQDLAQSAVRWAMVDRPVHITHRFTA